jgi:hypothetical protein
MKSAIEIFAEIGSVVLSFFAAALWWWASIENTPDNVALSIKDAGGMDVFGSHLEVLLGGLIEQGQRNVYGARCAAGAAALQGVTFILKFRKRS